MADAFKLSYDGTFLNPDFTPKMLEWKAGALYEVDILLNQVRRETPLNLTDMAGRRLSEVLTSCLLYTSPSPRDGLLSRMPSSA